MTWCEKQPEEKTYVMIAKMVEERKGKRIASIYDYNLRYEGQIPYDKAQIVLKKFVEKLLGE